MRTTADGSARFAAAAAVAVREKSVSGAVRFTRKSADGSVAASEFGSHQNR